MPPASSESSKIYSPVTAFSFLRIQILTQFFPKPMYNIKKKVGCIYMQFNPVRGDCRSTVLLLKLFSTRQQSFNITSLEHAILNSGRKSNRHIRPHRIVNKIMKRFAMKKIYKKKPYKYCAVLMKTNQLPSKQDGLYSMNTKTQGQEQFEIK